jgi:SAM-dependent methyltransferase
MSEAGGGNGFDAYADHYGDALAKGIAVSGESKEYFARGRVAWMAECLNREGAVVDRVMDFGCGTGTATPFLFDELGALAVVGVDISGASVARAREEHPDPRASFHSMTGPVERGAFDAVYCNGVFHHIPPAERLGALAYIFAVLKPGGYFALWENNPWNPGTQIVMSRIAFDRDAVKVSAPEARRLLRAAGFKIQRTDFHFIFPSVLGFLRFLERPLSQLPLGAQYQVLARKPG